MNLTQKSLKDLQDDLFNAEETLFDALDDTSCLGAEDVRDLRMDVARARKALADKGEL